MRTHHVRPLAAASLAIASLLALGAPAALAGQARDPSFVATNGPNKAPDAAREAEVARQQRLREAQVQAARGRQALAAGHYADARDALRQAVRLNPDDAASRRLLAEAEAALAIGPTQAGLLERVKESMAFQAKSLATQIDLELFEAGQALTKKDYGEAVRRAEAALANTRFIDDAARAAAARKRAEKALAEARVGRDRTAPLTVRKDSARARAERAAKADPAAADPQGAAGAFFSPKAGARERRARANELLADLEREATPPDPAQVVLPGKGKGARTRLLERPMESWERELRAKLAEPITVEFHETPLPEAVHQLRTLGQIPIVLDPQAAKHATPITLVSRGRIPLDAALAWVARFSGLRYCLRDGAVLLTTPHGVLQEPVQRDYDLSAFLAEAEDCGPATPTRPGPMEPGARRPGPARRPAPPDPDAIGEDWVHFIRATIDPGSWAGEGTVLQAAERPPFTIAYRNGRIVVVHTPEVQDQIQDLLNNFRRSLNLQVHVQARFIILTKASVESLNLSFGLDNLRGSDNRVVGSLQNATEVPNLSRFANYDNTGGLDMTIRHMGSESVSAFIKAVLKNQSGTVLQAPRLTMFNTQRANLQVLTNHNYVRRVTGDDEPEIGNIPEGMIFDVQPFVSADRRYITLVLQPQQRELISLVDYHFLTRTLLTEGTTTNVNVLIPYEVLIQIPTTRLRSIGTTVTIPNGGTLLVAGFMEIEENSGVATIPFVENIPVLREVFRGWDRNEGRSSLAILVSAQTVGDVFEE